MFGLATLGVILLVAAVVAIARHLREEKSECGRLRACLGGSSKQNEKSAAA